MPGVMATIPLISIHVWSGDGFHIGSFFDQHRGCRWQEPGAVTVVTSLSNKRAIVGGRTAGRNDGNSLEKVILQWNHAAWYKRFPNAPGSVWHEFRVSEITPREADRIYSRTIKMRGGKRVWLIVPKNPPSLLTRRQI